MAETLERPEDESVIEEIELGQSVLTLAEVIQTFEVESPMLNIKLPGAAKHYRTVVLTKNEVEVNGRRKMIVMINDASDRVRVARERHKKEKRCVVQGRFDEVFQRHREQV